MRRPTKISIANRLLIIKIFLIIPFGIMISILTLYLSHARHLSDKTAMTVTALFLGITGILKIPAGYLCDRYLDHRQMFLLSALLSLTGCLLLYFSNYFYLGLSIFSLGFALSLSVNAFLSLVFQADAILREKIFLRNYSGMNAGYILAFFLSGYYGLTESYSRLFLMMSASGFFALLTILLNWKLFHPQHATRLLKKPFGDTVKGILLILVTLLLVYLVNLYQYLQPVTCLLTILMLAALLFMLKQQATGNPRNKISICCILIGPVLIFSLLQSLSFTTLTFFIERNVVRDFAGLPVSPQWAQLVSTATVMMAGPLLTRFLARLRSHGFILNPAKLFSASLVLIGSSLLVIGIAIWISGELIPFSWIILSFMLQGMAELLIIPVGFTLIGDIFPPEMQGRMMGFWLLLPGLGSLLSGYLSLHIGNYKIAFLLLGAISILYPSFMQILVFRVRAPVSNVL